MISDKFLDTIRKIDALPPSARPQQTRALLLEMKDALEPDTGRVLLEPAKLAGRAGVSPRHIWVRLKALCDLGAIRSEPVAGHWFVNPMLLWIGSEGARADAAEHPAWQVVNQPDPDSKPEWLELEAERHPA